MHRIALMKLQHFLSERRLDESYQNILEVEQEVVPLTYKSFCKYALSCLMKNMDIKNFTLNILFNPLKPVL